ncbi:hypothetical protein L226DRAFT_569137 [Lentinus tigrinus ALCF2SS1-7]|uniref:uncharacterized protein n=1 Tax=Lentinus tigrinus ALCF2SS1-7 TaxID=1328758 RepID=UPI001165D43F|nr:hypothetical protein L226DRAFT_569137 [Lentinus tigrinus ALCF2SS1-7]
MSRFILNLRTVPIDPSHTLPTVSWNPASESTRMTELRFAASAFDNLGAPLDVEGANDSEHEHGYLEVEEEDDEGTSHGPGVVGEYHAVPEEEDELPCRADSLGTVRTETPKIPMALLVSKGLPYRHPKGAVGAHLGARLGLSVVHRFSRGGPFW